MKIWKKLLQVDRVHLESIGNASRYIRTHYAYAVAFIVYSTQVFTSHDDKVWNNEIKRKRGGHYKTAATKRLSFFLSIKAYLKSSDVDTSEFRIQKYADFHCRLNFTKFTHLYL